MVLQVSMECISLGKRGQKDLEHVCNKQLDLDFDL